MLVRFGDYIEKFRCELENIVEYFHNNSQNFEESDKKIIKYFEMMKEKNYDLYTQVLGLLLSDHYKLLYEQEKISELKEDDKEILDLYDELHENSDVVNYIESDVNILISLFYQMSDYNSLDYFTKREILICCEDIFDKLKSFSAFNILDYLYYCQKYNVEIFKTLFHNDTKNGCEKEVAIHSLHCTLEELNINDKQNYLELISDLLVEYYRLGKYEMRFKKHPTRISRLDKTLNFLENSDTLEIMKIISSDNDKVINEVLKRAMNFNDEVKSEPLDNIYQKTITKLKSIKEFKQ